MSSQTVVSGGHKSEPLFKSVNKWWFLDIWDERFLLAWLNNSRTKEYKWCPKQFWYKNLSGIKEVDNTLMSKGRYIHAQIEKYNLRVLPEEVFEALQSVDDDEVYEVLYNTCKEFIPEDEEMEETFLMFLETEEKRARELIKILPNKEEFIRYFRPRNPEEYIVLAGYSINEELTVCNMFGTIDNQLLGFPYHLKVRDYKFSEVKKRIDKKTGEEEEYIPQYYRNQGVFYTYLISNYWGVKCEDYSFHFLKSDVILEAKTLRRSITALKKRLKEVREGIWECLATGIWPMIIKPLYTCKWCGFQQDCKKNWKDSDFIKE